MTEVTNMNYSLTATREQAFSLIRNRRKIYHACNDAVNDWNELKIYAHPALDLDTTRDSAMTAILVRNIGVGY